MDNVTRIHATLRKPKAEVSRKLIRMMRRDADNLASYAYLDPRIAVFARNMRRYSNHLEELL